MSQEDCLEEVNPELSFKEPLCPGRFRTGLCVSSGGNDSNNDKSCCVSELWPSARHPFNSADIPRRQNCSSYNFTNEKNETWRNVMTFRAGGCMVVKVLR